MKSIQYVLGWLLTSAVLCLAAESLPGGKVDPPGVGGDVPPGVNTDDDIRCEIVDSGNTLRESTHGAVRCSVNQESLIVSVMMDTTHMVVQASAVEKKSTTSLISHSLTLVDSSKRAGTVTYAYKSIVPRNFSGVMVELAPIKQSVEAVVKKNSEGVALGNVVSNYLPVGRAVVKFDVTGRICTHGISMNGRTVSIGNYQGLDSVVFDVPRNLTGSIKVTEQCEAIDYEIVNQDAEHCSMNWEKTSFRYPSTIKFTPSCTNGYSFDGAVLKDASGKGVSYTDEGDGSYSVDVPASNITAQIKEVLKYKVNCVSLNAEGGSVQCPEYAEPGEKFEVKALPKITVDDDAFTVSAGYYVEKDREQQNPLTFVAQTPDGGFLVSSLYTTEFTMPAKDVDIFVDFKKLYVLTFVQNFLSYIELIEPQGMEIFTVSGDEKKSFVTAGTEIKFKAKVGYKLEGARYALPYSSIFEDLNAEDGVYSFAMPENDVGLMGNPKKVVYVVGVKNRDRDGRALGNIDLSCTECAVGETVYADFSTEGRICENHDVIAGMRTVEQGGVSLDWDNDGGEDLNFVVPTGYDSIFVHNSCDAKEYIVTRVNSEHCRIKIPGIKTITSYNVSVENYTYPYNPSVYTECESGYYAKQLLVTPEEGDEFFAPSSEEEIGVFYPDMPASHVTLSVVEDVLYNIICESSDESLGSVTCSASLSDGNVYVDVHTAPEDGYWVYGSYYTVDGSTEQISIDFGGYEDAGFEAPLGEIHVVVNFMPLFSVDVAEDIQDYVKFVDYAWAKPHNFNMFSGDVIRFKAKGGYAFGDVKVLDADENEVDVAEDKGVYTFIVPKSDVTISATLLYKVTCEDLDEQIAELTCSEYVGAGDNAVISVSSMVGYSIRYGYYTIGTSLEKHSFAVGGNGLAFIPMPSDSINVGFDVAIMYKFNASDEFRNAMEFTDWRATVVNEKFWNWDIEENLPVSFKAKDGIIFKNVKILDADNREVAVTFKDGEYSFTMPASDVTLSADVAKVMYTIKVAVNDSKMGSVSGLSETGVYEMGTEVKLIATAKTGYEFSNWQDDVKTAERTIKVTGDETYTATFKAVAASSSSAKSSSSSAKVTSSSSSKAKSSSSSAKAKSSSSKKADSKSSSSKGKDAIVAMAQLPQFSVTAIGRDVQIASAEVGAPFAILDMQGRVMVSGRVESANFNLAIARAGTFMVRIGYETQVVRIK